ncbi:hypothetical protein BY996DRAFT_4578954 [Phakopsora pachyrhizi]|nr:hypothetical protein BY996DRAFT_4578954 [Phakopsora pachyrhizi]
METYKQSSAWTEHRSPTGRLYWYNSATSTSSWERPDELKTPAERALASTPWKEYQTAEGRKYWHHTQTKETTWTLPNEVKETIEKAAASAPPQPVSSTPSDPPPVVPPTTLNQKPVPMHPTFVPASNMAALGQSPILPNGAPGPYNALTTNLPARPLTSILHSAPAPNPVVPVTMPEFKSPEDAERAFIGLLRVKGVNPSWTWEQTMRDIITEPLYKALDTLAARKAAWEKFIENERKREKENREKNIARVRSSWNSGLDSLGVEKIIVNEEGVEVKLPPAPPRLWWTYERLKLELEKKAPEVWKLCRDDEERKVLWEDYLSELRQRDLAVANQLRARQQEKLANLLRGHEEKLNLPGPLETIQWRVAQEAILQSEEFQQDEDLRKMEDLDILIAFEDEVKKAEKDSAEAKAKQKDEKRRLCRKARASYIQLLHELKLAGEIKAGTMWKDIYPLIEEEERYQSLLGLPGSTPLELYWDVVDDLDLEVEANQRKVEDILSDIGKNVTEDTPLDEFLTWLPPDSERHKLDLSKLKEVFSVLHDFAVRIAKDEKRRAEKRLRNQIEDLRYSLKKLSPPIEINIPYEEALSRFNELPEYKALEGHEEGRREAFNRYMERLKEKAVLDDKKTRRREDDQRSEAKKKAHSQLSDDDGSVISSSKRRKRDLIDDDGHRHRSPRNSRAEDVSSPKGRLIHREDRDYDHQKDVERSRLKDRDTDRKNDRNSISERVTEYDTERGSEKNLISLDKSHDEEKSKSRDRDRSRETDRDKNKAKDLRDRTKEREDSERPSSRSQTDDRERRRKEYDLDRHGSRHHRSSRRDRENDDREGDRIRSARHEGDDRSSRDSKPSASKEDFEGSEKIPASRDVSELKTKNSHKATDGQRKFQRVKTDQTKEKLTEKSDGEEGELEG